MSKYEADVNEVRNVRRTETPLAYETKTQNGNAYEKENWGSDCLYRKMALADKHARKE